MLVIRLYITTMLYNLKALLQYSIKSRVIRTKGRTRVSISIIYFSEKEIRII